MPESATSLRVFTLLVALALLPACKKTVALSPENVAVVPVTTPTVYQFGPGEDSSVITLNMDIAGKKQSFGMTLDRSVTARGGRLDWRIRIPAWSENGKWRKASVPLAEVAMETDRSGLPGKVDATSPLLTDAGESPSAELRKNLEKLKTKALESARPLPKSGIVSGQALQTIALDTDADEFGLCITPKSAPLVLDGEFIKDGVAFVAASLHMRATILDRKSGERVRADIDGYQFLRKRDMSIATAAFTTKLLSGKGEVFGVIRTRVVSQSL